MRSVDLRAVYGSSPPALVSKNSHPTSKWLEHAKTSMARKRIRAYITEHGGILEKFWAKE
jgi:hypothetical protein